MVREGHWDEGRILRNSGTYDQPLTSRFTSEQIEQIERASGDDLVTLGGKITKWIARKYRVSGKSLVCSFPVPSSCPNSAQVKALAVETS